MATRKKNENKSATKIRPATTPEAREQQLMSLAVDLIEQRLLDGTASSQEVTTIIKLSSTRAKLEKEVLEKELALKEAKIQNLQAIARIEELYANATEAFKRYQGEEEYEEDY